jgi:hypothetical protein
VLPYAREIRAGARRILEHGSARDVLTIVASRGVMPWLTGTPGCDGSILRFSEDFTDLQLARIRADYDLEYKPTKGDALVAIARAERVMQELATARRRCPDQLQAICVAMDRPAQGAQAHAPVSDRTHRTHEDLVLRRGGSHAGYGHPVRVIC